MVFCKYKFFKGDGEMLTAYKVYCKDMVIGGTVGATIGGTAGAAAGKVGLRQLCKLPNLKSNDECQDVVAMAAQDSVQMGAATGAAVGFGIGFFLYPAYRALARAIWEKEVRPVLASSDSLGWLPSQ